MERYRVENTTELFRSKIFSVWEGLATPDPGKELRVVRLQAPDWVNVIPFDSAGRVLMIRQFRFGSAKLTWEFPGGNVDHGEDPERAAVRELEEETGWTARRLVRLGRVNPNPAFQTNTLHCFAAYDLENLGAKRLDENEDTEERFWQWEEVRSRLGGPDFDHGVMLCTAWFYLQWLETQK